MLGMYGEGMEDELQTINNDKSMKRAVLLIGSSDRKEAVAQFLLHPGSIESGSKMPWESNILSLHVHCGSVESFHLSMIDIPILALNTSSDAQRILGIVKQLKSLPKTVIVACIAVINYNSKADQQLCKATLQYYANLLPSLFEQNLVIVMTDYMTNNKMSQRRQRLNIDEMELSIVREIVNSVPLSHTPKFFMLDCAGCDENGIKPSSEVRYAILEHLSSCTPLSTADQTVISKPHYMMEMDKEMAKVLEEEIAALNNELEQCKEKEYSKLNALQQLEVHLTSTNERIANLQSKITEHDSSDLIVVDTWSIDSEWRLLKRCTGNFSLNSKWIIDKVEQWDKGDPQWIFTEKTDFKVVGTVIGQCNKGLQASLTIKTTKQRIYASEILNWQCQMGELVQLQKTQNESKEIYQKEIRDCNDKYDILLQFIERKQDLITNCLRSSMTINEAVTRLEQYTHK